MGLHTGAPCAVRVLEAPAETGLWFRRIDGPDEPLPVMPSSVVATDRRTVLGRAGATISTVEHLLAALAGAGIWNAVVEVNGPEVPALDGSALPFVVALRRLRRRPRPPAIRLRRAVQINRDGAAARAEPAAEASLRCHIHFDHPAIGSQCVGWQGTYRQFVRDVAPARTFGFVEEVVALRSKGLAQGGSTGNALVYGREGPLTQPRMAMEPAWHKLLDAMGDLALLGRPLHARVDLDNPGHHINVALVEEIWRQATAGVAVGP